LPTGLDSQISLFPLAKIAFRADRFSFRRRGGTRAPFCPEKICRSTELRRHPPGPFAAAFPAQRRYNDVGRIISAFCIKSNPMPADLIQPFRALAYNNAWANHRLLTACEQLTEGEFAAARTGFFPSLQRTLNHIYVIDLFYIDALEGGWLGPRAWENELPFPSLAQLKPAQAAMDRRLIAFCEAQTPASLTDIIRINRDTRVQNERCDRLLMHLFQHQIHHRGQAHAMLSGTSVAPPQHDEFFAADEAPLRANEFAELSWTEETVWRGS
jgi:uncharacterized damage-inducible protein DinB